MAGICVERLPHSCGSEDGLQVFYDETEDKYTGYCFRCKKFISNPYEESGGVKPTTKPKGKTQEEIDEEIEEILSCPFLPLPDRKLRQETVEYFGVHVGLDEANGKDVKFHFYPYEKDFKLMGFKTRLVPNKRMWCVGNLRDVDLFGWKQAVATGAKRLIITEGEIDAMSLYQILKDKNRGTQWEKFDPAVVSLPHGAPAAERDIGRLLNKIKRNFQEIVFVPDQDDVGKAAADALSRLSDKIIIANLPDKDANECLVKGKSKGAAAAVLFKATKEKNTRIIRGSTLREVAKKKPEYGIPYPWEGLTRVTRGIRRGETLYFGAGTKMGKSELVNALAINIIKQKLPVFLVKPEEATAKTYQKLVGKMAGRIFHDPDIEFDEEAFDEAEKEVGDYALIQDIYQFVDWDTLKDDIVYVVRNEGVQDVFLDPITCFTNQMDSGEANTFLTSMTAELSAMSKDYNFTSYIFCHLKAPTFGEPHERGGKVMSSQFAGSRAMQRCCNYMIGMEGNKDPDLSLEERNCRSLVLLEDREFGQSARVDLYWDYKTGLFNEI